MAWVSLSGQKGLRHHYIYMYYIYQHLSIPFAASANYRNCYQFWRIATSSGEFQLQEVPPVPEGPVELSQHSLGTTLLTPYITGEGHGQGY